MKILLNLFVVFICLTNITCATIFHSRKELRLPAKAIVLTFDDGPNAIGNTTLNLLSVLKKHNVKAYFCLIGENIVEYPELVRAIDSSGNIIVNHGYTDQEILTKSDQNIKDDISKWNAELQRAIGKKKHKPVHYFRPAYGIYNPSIKKLLLKEHMKILPASFYALDAEVGPSGQKTVVSRTINEVKKLGSAIIVLHDGKDSHVKLKTETENSQDSKYNRSWIPEAADSIITLLKKDGYIFTLMK
jgi:peptidoglycan-N-acetylglucosamine deacetylase